MKKIHHFAILRSFLISTTLFSSNLLVAQQQTIAYKSPSSFWSKVQFGGGIGLSVGSGYTDIAIAPSAIYNFSEQVALGVGVQYAYIKQRNYYASHLYGGSIIGLFNPLEEIQLSAELEQLRVNEDLDGSYSNSQDYWNTGLFLGAGYRSGNVTIGVRYNVLNDNNNIYGSPFMPFARVYF